MAMTAGTVTCPVCGVAVPLNFTLATLTGSPDGRTVSASLSADETDLYAHAWTHEQE